ncbi:mitochondrial import receptor subunit TOM20 homolog [Octopus sinensis]|uniref:Mitochondrial import receptor subunit TOM20 homolog n=1 Tax=Octopus sinensis TaxID=2607531 RepID=A0A6P7S5B7_9MOLL|nr:mitochondrial import receptor subunit TOM20 homolog [Octopus sinensis]
MLPKSPLGIAAAGVGICFLGYCIYFDHKRRSDPLFKQKLRERRRKQRQNAKKGPTPLPAMNSPLEMQKFFLQEVHNGEELLAQGDINGGIEHLSNAVAVCGQPHQLLQVLQQTLPAHVFQKLLEQLPIVTQRFANSNSAESSSKVTEEELE